jgi:phosphoribosylamine--glycine ligase
MADLVHGMDSLSSSPDVAVGVLLAHGDFPTGHDKEGTWAGYPIKGINKRNINNLHFQQIQEGKYATATGEESGILSAGNYLLVATGTGSTVAEASSRAYKVAWGVEMPSNLMFRTDIGQRLKKDLPTLHDLGYAKGMHYG